ncbi:MAG: L-aspartate oxidase [Bdellovibrionales bacterium]|nr:L-aspartate oxidase [Bdellovibrionales bacterium]
MESSDFLVVGSGIAGLIYALDVAAFGTVTVLCKSDPTEGSTRYAQGGIASVTSPLDSFEAHIEDTLDAGAGLCHREIVEILVREGPERIRQLISLGTRFDRDLGSNQYQLGQEGGHSVRRILHAGDATGAEIQRAVFEHAAKHPNIRILANQVVIDLITAADAGGRREVLGAYSLQTDTGEVRTYRARCTMLATGGAGKVYLYTSNPDVATGDGIAMAYRAGAAVANMEFFQFHPTCLYHPEAKSFLITEAMRGEGAMLLTQDGKPFMQAYDSRGELAPRDIVARAIDDQMKRSGDKFVLLDISHRDPEFIRSRFPTICERVQQFGFDLTSEPLPVVPAAHYCCGGVVSDEFGKTTLHRLYTAGETAFTGVHGANRLASNSLLEALVFASRAARHSIEHLPQYATVPPVREWDSLDTVKSSEEVLVTHTWEEVRRMMWNLVGIVRSDKRLHLAERRLQIITEEIRDYYWHFRVTKDLVELRNITQVAALIIACGLRRKESRGLHFNVDYPQRDDEHWRKDTILTKDGG